MLSLSEKAATRSSRRATLLPEGVLLVVGKTPYAANRDTEDAMSWVTVLWSMIASACLTLALVHGLVWWRHREAWANLLFALTAVATSLLAAGEVWMMRAETPEQFGMAVRWTHLPAWALIVSLVGFVRALSARRATMARLDGLWPADTVAHPQFFHGGESQLPGGYRATAHSIPR